MLVGARAVCIWVAFVAHGVAESSDAGDEVCIADGSCLAGATQAWQVVQAQNARGRRMTPEDLEVRWMDRPGPLNDGEIRLRPAFLSPDPYMRGQASNADLGKTFFGYQVAEVVESRSADYLVGNFVHCLGPWQQEYVQTASALPEGYLVPRTDAAPKTSPTVPISAYIGVLGMPGKTAFGGVFRIGDLRGDGSSGALRGATVLVSGAAGVVGSAVGQMARALGAGFVIGTAGSQAKIQHLLDLGFDAAISYKEKTTASDMEAAMRDSLIAAGRSPHIDFYFDNTGGHVTAAAWPLLRDGARVAVCGGIVHYESDGPDGWDAGRWAFLNGVPTSGFPRPTKIGDPVVANDAGRSIIVESFIWNELHRRKPYLEEFFTKAHEWIAEGKLNLIETVMDGYQRIPEAFVGLFSGVNVGKMIVRV